MKRLLIIEDDASNRENFCEIFMQEGYDVFGASCGKEGIELAASTRPDLIICDIMMPGIDGFEVKKMLDKNKNTSSIPFVYLTAKAEIKDVQYALELGADDYMIKPVSSARLLELVSKRLHRIDAIKQNNDDKILDDTTLSLNEKIILKSGGKHILVNTNEIVIIKAFNNYCNITLSSGQKAIVKGTLKSWEKILPEKSFLRIHRSTIINLELIVKIESIINGSYVVSLKDYPHLIYFSQRYSQKIRKLFLMK
ncbi:MAG: response regulator [Ignavibacteriaceae bacterium]|jgi:DNA-binding LytR/AlgR family response regulator